MTNPTAHGVSVFDGLVDAPSDLSAAIARVRERLSRHGDIPGALDAELTLVLAAAEQWNAYNERKQRVIAAGMGRSPLRDAAERAAAQPVAWQLLRDDGSPADWIRITPPLPDQPEKWRALYANTPACEPTRHPCGHLMVSDACVVCDSPAACKAHESCCRHDEPQIAPAEQPVRDAYTLPAPDVAALVELLRKMQTKHGEPWPEFTEAADMLAAQQARIDALTHARATWERHAGEYMDERDELRTALAGATAIANSAGATIRTLTEERDRACEALRDLLAEIYSDPSEPVAPSLATGERARVALASGPTRCPHGIEHCHPCGLCTPLLEARANTCWLIERGQKEFHTPTIWYTGGSSHPEDARYGGRWTENANRAIRYATQEECEATVYNEFMRYWGDKRVNCHASEHVFLSQELTYSAAIIAERTRCAAIARKHGAEDIAGEIEG